MYFSMVIATLPPFVILTRKIGISFNSRIGSPRAISVGVWFFDNGALSCRHSRHIADLDYLKTRETAKEESGDFCRS